MKKIFSFLVPIFLLFIIVTPVFAEKNDDVYFFHSLSCPHCKKENAFLEKMEKKYPELKVNRYEVSKNYKNVELLRKMGKEVGINVSGVPVLIVDGKSIVGYQNDETTGKKVQLLLENHLKVHGEDKEITNTINIPILGEKNINTISLPMLTLTIGLLDGFNPCAMWVLVFLITLLLGMKDRKRMWILGGTFIFVSGFVYFLFLSAWLNLFLFLGFITIVRMTIGIVALASGIYHVREYFTNKEATCKMTKSDKQKETFSKLRKIVSNDKLIISLLGISLLAGAVNLVELVCSAGFPAVYTQVLALADLPAWQHYAYLVGYIFFFMLDDLIVFIIAMTTLKMTFINAKYTRYSNIIGGILMLLIGVLLIFKPSWIMFG